MSVHKPSDFTSFWDAVDTELARVSQEVHVSHDVRPAIDGVRVHRLTFHSLDSVVVGGWLAVPERAGPHPGLVIFPGYKSDPMPAIGWARRGYATFTLAHRGKLGATGPFNPGYPGLLTHGITAAHSYAYRGIYADCMRALEVMTDRDDVAGPLAVYGYSQGGPLSLFACARRSTLVGAVVAGAPFLTAFAYSTLAARTYPYFEIAEYLANHPDERDTVFNTLAYFDALHAIGDVTAPLLLFRAGADEICPPFSTTLLRQVAPPNVRWHEYEQSGHDATGVRAVGDAAAFFAEILSPPKPVVSALPDVAEHARLTPPEMPALVSNAAMAATASRVASEDRSRLHPAAARTRFVTITTGDGAQVGAYVSQPDATANREAGVIVECTPYASVLSLAHPEDRERHTVITLAHRGMRGTGFAAPWMLPGLFDPTEVEADRFTQLVADNLHVLATLLPTVHTKGSPVIGVGPDWMLAVAAASGVFTHLEVDSFWLTGQQDAQPEFEYPRRELYEQAHTYPGSDTATARWCDPVFWAGHVSCDLLVVCADNAVSRARAQQLVGAHAGPNSVHVSDIRSALESEWRDQRRSALLGVTPAIRWQAARSGVRV